MIYIHQTSCIAAQSTFSDIPLNELNETVENKLLAIETMNSEIPVNLLRRMGKAVRLGISTGLPLLKQTTVNGIAIGTGNGGLEDCIKFLNQIIDYEEGKLTPTNFVQSTTNAIAAQLSILGSNKQYNITHVHRGLSFENAIIDVFMLLKENPLSTYLVGGIDEISNYNYSVEFLAGLYKKESISNKDLYLSKTDGTIAGEGAAMFIVNNNAENACAQINAIHTIHSENADDVIAALKSFLSKYVNPDNPIDVFFSGENGDARIIHFYSGCEKLLEDTISIVRYKHMVGEFRSVSALALYLSCEGIKTGIFPDHMYKRKKSESIKNILIYNCSQGLQHSFLLVSKCNTN